MVGLGGSASVDQGLVQIQHQYYFVLLRLLDGFFGHVEWACIDGGEQCFLMMLSFITDMVFAVKEPFWHPTAWLFRHLETDENKTVLAYQF